LSLSTRSGLFAMDFILAMRREGWKFRLPFDAP